MLKRFFHFLLPLPFFALCLAMIAASSILGKIDLDQMDRHTFVRVMQIRDFRHFPPELVERLTLWAEKEFGRNAVQKPIFEFPAWEKNIHLRSKKNRTNQPSRSEINMNLMAKVRFFQWMQRYQKGSLLQKAALLNEVVQDMNYWNEVYLDYIRYLELPEPTFKELYENFEQVLESFKVGASPKETIDIDAFSKDMRQALLADGIQKSLKDYFPIFRTKQP